MKIRHKLYKKVTVFIKEGEFNFIDGVIEVPDKIGKVLLSKNKNLEEIKEPVESPETPEDKK